MGPPQVAAELEAVAADFDKWAAGWSHEKTKNWRLRPVWQIWTSSEL
jgi:hypothetical protein